MQLVLVFMVGVSSGFVPTIQRQPRQFVGRGRVLDQERQLVRSSEESVVVRKANTLSDVRGGVVADSAAYPRSKYNLPILLALLSAALSALLFRDVIAILALREYDSVMEADWIPESLKLLTRLPTDMLRDYGTAAKDAPVFVKACTSAVAYLVGDVVAQAYEGRRRVEYLDLSRAARNSASGFLLHGPLLHYWIDFLEGPATLGFCGALGLETVAPNSPEEFGLIASKIALDQTVFALCFNTIYAIGLGIFAMRSFEEVADNVKTTLLPSLFSSWRFWPLVHLISYSPIVPVEYKLLYIDFMEIFWVAILSLIANDEKQQTGIDPSIAVYDEYDVQPAVEIVLASQLEKESSSPPPPSYDENEPAAAADAGNNSPDPPL